MKWRLIWLVTVLAVSLGVVGVGLASESRLRFSIPKGWVNISSNAPAGDSQAIPAQFLAVLAPFRQRGYMAAAVDLDAIRKGSLITMTASMLEAGSPITWTSVEEVARLTVAENNRLAKADRWELHSSGVVRVNAVECGRIVSVATLPDVRMFTLTYMIPDGERLAAVQYSAPVTDFTTKCALYDSVVASTVGLSPLTKPYGGRAPGFASWAGSGRKSNWRYVGLVMGVVVYLWRSRRL